MVSAVATVVEVEVEKMATGEGEVRVLLTNISVVVVTRDPVMKTVDPILTVETVEAAAIAYRDFRQPPIQVVTL